MATDTTRKKTSRSDKVRDPAIAEAGNDPLDDGRGAGPSPVQPQLLSRINEALVIRAIRQHGPSTRGELSQRMGVTFPTVAKAVGSLLDGRLLEEFDDAMTGPGRPAKRLRLSREN